MKYWWMVCMMSVALIGPAWADDASFTFIYSQPTKRIDNTTLTTLSSIRFEFTKTDTSEWIPDITVPVPDPNGGRLTIITTTLPYPNGGSETGTMDVFAIDSASNESLGVSEALTASLASTIGPAPGTVIGACTPP